MVAVWSSGKRSVEWWPSGEVTGGVDLTRGEYGAHMFEVFRGLLGQMSVRGRCRVTTGRCNTRQTNLIGAIILVRDHPQRFGS